MERPYLTEPGVKYFINETLKQCHITKDKYYNFAFNVIAFLIFIIVIGLTLNYKYRGAMDFSEKQKREQEKKKYILGQIQKMQRLEKNNSMDLITNLPIWKNEM
tara:strand:- start:340 stop:651 length:312 start_codon:yes stop_codon:yes gene_type:complete